LVPTLILLASLQPPLWPHNRFPSAAGGDDGSLFEAAQSNPLATIGLRKSQETKFPERSADSGYFFLPISFRRA
ncbi:MAG: hypothetical protein ACREUU_05935, partial [Gammaproteobacteria bacterium]